MPTATRARRPSARSRGAAAARDARERGRDGAAATTTTRDGAAGRVLWDAVREVSAMTLQRAVRRSGLLDHGFVVL